MKTSNSYIIHLLFMTFTVSLNCQSDPNNRVFNGNKESIKQNFTGAEVEYRKAISKNENQTTASHNLGNLLFENINRDNLTDLEFLVRDAIERYFPKLEILNIDLQGAPDSNLVSFTLNFRLVDTQIEDEITINFEQ